jgi:pseudouridine-5'-phosphate glycosidase
MAARDSLGDSAALLIANPLPPDKQLDPALHNRVLKEALAAADQASVRGKAVTPFLLDYMQRATEGKSVEVNLDVARGNIALAGEIATAWSIKATGGAY